MDFKFVKYHLCMRNNAKCPDSIAYIRDNILENTKGLFAGDTEEINEV